MSEHDRRALAADARAGFPGRGGGARVVRGRARLARALWSVDGRRKLVGARELDRALAGVSAAELEWICEFSALGPLYLLPTRSFVHLLAKQIRQLGVRRVLEVAAGDGLLSRALAAADTSLEVRATDSGAWERPAARMNAKERRALRNVAVAGVKLGDDVQRMSARRAIAAHRPELVLCSWLPPGGLLDSLIRAPVRYVLEIGADSGITGNAYCWRFAHEFCEGALGSAARCQLDTRPKQTLHSRITLYFARAHEEFYEERVHPGDWLWQYSPKSRPRRLRS